MNLDRIEKIADAVLYEGYMLYPYRHSSVKNQQRWNWGVLHPPGYCLQQAGSDRCSIQTECLIKADSSTRFNVKVRFLQIVQRTVRKPVSHPLKTSEFDEPATELVDRLEVAGRVYQPWQEAIERAVEIDGLDPQSLHDSSTPFSIPEGSTSEDLLDANGLKAGALVRQWHSLERTVEINSEICRGGVVKLRLQVHNRTQGGTQTQGRDAILLDSLVSAHVILSTDNGEFISLLEPHDSYKDLAAGCENIGTWPVLAGGDASCVLSSPIILYDQPQIAPESVGNLFDSTEIDEILSLRILTLTDAEKQEMRQSDDRTRGILERTENMDDEQFMKLHGVLRGLNTGGEELP